MASTSSSSSHQGHSSSSAAATSATQKRTRGRRGPEGSISERRREQNRNAQARLRARKKSRKSDDGTAAAAQSISLAPKEGEAQSERKGEPVIDLDTILACFDGTLPAAEGQGKELVGRSNTDSWVTIFNDAPSSLSSSSSGNASVSSVSDPSTDEHDAFLDLLASNLTMPSTNNSPSSSSKSLRRRPMTPPLPVPDLKSDKILISSRDVTNAYFTNAFRLGFKKLHVNRVYAASPIAAMWAKRSTSGLFDLLPSQEPRLICGDEGETGAGLTILPSSLSGAPDRFEEFDCALSVGASSGDQVSFRSRPDATSFRLFQSWTREEEEAEVVSDWKAHWEDVPENMWPTQLQLQLPHSLFIDTCIPWPEVRDRVLLMLSSGALDPSEFKQDAIKNGRLDGSDSSPFLIHGPDTMDPDAWEVSEGWFRKYAFLLDNKILRRTNWWRKVRGARPIELPAGCMSQVERTARGFSHGVMPSMGGLMRGY